MYGTKPNLNDALPGKWTIKRIILLIAVLFTILFVFISFRSIVETNVQGEYQVKQAFYTGTMTARMTPGTYFQNFGIISTYRAVATIGFGNEKGEGSADIDAIPVIFSDGSKADISGLVRIKLPTTREGIIGLKKEYASGYDHFIESGVVPVIKNAVKLSANLRSAQDAYTTLALFQQAIDDQLENGIYLTRSDKIVVTNSAGDTEERKVTVILEDENGDYLRKPNRLQELGCEVTECVIDVPAFDDKVEDMIALRKDEAMKTELAKQSAIRAKQDAITAEEQGKANVATAKYEKEVEKVRAVTDAQKAFEVAELEAKQAIEQKKKKIEVAKGIAEELRIADGLSEREKYTLQIEKETRIGVANALKDWKGPQNVILGGEGGNGQSNIENALMLKMFMEMTNTKVD